MKNQIDKFNKEVDDLIKILLKELKDSDYKKIRITKEEMIEYFTNFKSFHEYMIKENKFLYEDNINLFN